MQLSFKVAAQYLYWLFHSVQPRDFSINPIDSESAEITYKGNGHIDCILSQINVEIITSICHSA